MVKVRSQLWTHPNWPDAQMVSMTLDKGDIKIFEAVMSYMHHRHVKETWIYVWAHVQI